MLRIILTGLFLLTATSVSTIVNADDSIAVKKYAVCAGCHGFTAEGNATVNAPALAGQEVWYLQRQMKNFAAGIRGGKNDDAHGQTMGTMIKTLATDDDFDLVARYLSNLPVTTSEASFSGDSTRGKTFYATCSACHGAKAEGNQALNAPALTGMSDFYMLSQLAKYKSGQRGKHPQDKFGMQMAPMAATLADEQAMKDVIAYINSL